MARVYATRADLLAYLAGSTLATQVPAEPEATRKLTRASELIDDMLLAAVYDVDSTTGLPTNATVTAALRDAVCAQVAWWLETGDESGAAASQYQSVSIGSVSLSRGYTGAGSSTGPSQRICPDAAAHLRRAAPAITFGVATGAVWRW